jgi:hypothetical protein
MTTLRKPAWWQLYTLVPVLGGLFIVEHHAALPSNWHMGVQVGIVFLIYRLVWRWLGTNAYALMTGPTLYHRHDYNANDADDWAHATNGDGAPRRWPAHSASALHPWEPLPVAWRAARDRGEDFAPRKHGDGTASRHWPKIA